MESPLYLRQLELGPMQNFVYLIGDKEAKECVVVDPGWDVPTILKTAESDGLKITKILITHGHPDHTNGVESLLAKNDCKVYVQKHEADFMKFRWPNLIRVESGEMIDVGKIKIRAIHTPGHTPGSQCFQVENGLVSGDTLFINSCGRVDLPGSNPEQMYDSLQKLRALDDQVILYPGHNYADDPTSTIGSEKQTNPYLQFPNAKEFLRAMTGGLSGRWY